MRLSVLSIQDVVERQLCCGCGACAGVRPDAFAMIDTLAYGRRPVGVAAKAGRNGAALRDADADGLRVCPGAELSHDRSSWPQGTLRELAAGWGPVLELWEGYAGDAELRYAGSSGAAASALALYAIERGGMHGLLHITSRPDVRYLNQTVLSTTRAEILAATGSRYAPASPCDGLPLIERAPAACVLIGKPCDVAGAAKAARLRPRLAEKLGLTIAIFCAGTPTNAGTLALLRRMGVEDPASVVSLRYRGNGWPGQATVVLRTERGYEQRQLSYDESWGQVLTRYKQWRCQLCPDHTGEFADIAVGDPWYRPIPEGEPGRSLVLVRTERGRRVLHAAIQAGYLTLERSQPRILAASQPNLLRARAATGGRLAMLRLLGIPTPRFAGLPLLRFWLTRLGPRDWVRSTLGTLRRVLRRGLLHRHPAVAMAPPLSEGASTTAGTGGSAEAVAEAGGAR